MTLTATAAGKWRIDVNLGTALAPDWAQVRGMTNFVPATEDTIQDSSDYDDGFWGSDTITGAKWANTLTVLRKSSAPGVYDPGQEYLRAASEARTPVQVRWYDRTGGPEAYEGTALVQWARQGGPRDDLDSVEVTLMGQGARLTLPANPAQAFSDTWTLKVTGTPAGGTFKLAVDAVATGPIAYDATGQDVENALNAIPGVTSTVTGTVTKTVTFSTARIVTLHDNSLTGGTDPSVEISAV